MTDAQPPREDLAAPKEAEIDPQQIWKLLVELGPLLLFFFVNSRAGIFWGTGTLIVATAISIVVSRVMFGKLAIMPLVSAFFVIIFGGLTLWLADDLFIKLKPTIVNLIFATVLLGGLAFGHSLLRHLFGDVFKLTEEGWRKLTLRWGLFFAALAVLNEIVWRNFTTDTWVSFKVFGIMPLTMLFGISQMGLLKTYEVKPDVAGT
ncbi:MAG: septation protein A [Deltaproteobacteria bacterium]